MKVKINDQTIKIFEGAKVGDVLRKFSPSEWKAVDSGKKKSSTGMEIRSP